jgi:hypothetical protein
MSFANAKLLRHPLLLLAFGFMLQMCVSNSDQNTPTGNSYTTGGTPDGGPCSGADECRLPPSRCSDDGTALIYYTSPSCTKGTCSWVQQQIACYCYNGACGGTFNTAGPGTFNTAGPAGGYAGSGGYSTVNTAGPIGGGGWPGASGSGGLSGAGGLNDLDASDAAESSDADADAALQACNSPSDCALPPSYCLDSSTLVFTQEATCTAHLCTFTFSQMKCPCSGNGCIATTTK